MKNTDFFENFYLKDIKKRLDESGISYDEEKLKSYLLSSVKDEDVIIRNNEENQDYIIEMSRLLNLIVNKGKLVVTPYNTMFKTANECPSIIADIQIELGDLRKSFKKLMFENIMNPFIYGLNDIRQNTVKVIANSFYGCMGEKSFHFFNPYLGPSVTSQGRNLIANAITSFEAFLSGNIFFENFDELSFYIHNILCETDVADNVIQEISIEDVINRILPLIRFEYDDSLMEYLYLTFKNCTPSQLNKLYYKNNLFEFLENENIKEFVLNAFNIDHFLNVEEVPEDIKEELNLFNNMVEYFVSYHYPIENKMAKVKHMSRDGCFLVDTDSTFLCLNQWLEFMCDGCGLDKHNLTAEQKCSIITVMTFILTEFIDSCLYKSCVNINVREQDTSRINMKSEFILERVMLTKNKKNYAAIQLAREGKILPKPKLDIKGLPIRKVQTPKPARIFFADMLERDILKAPMIKPFKVFKVFTDFEQEVANSLINGSTEYLKAVTVKAIHHYANPFSLQQVRGFLVWNECFPHKAIPAHSAIRVVPLKNLSRDEFASLIGDDEEGKRIMECLDRIVTLKVEDLNPNSEKGSETFCGKSRQYVDILGLPFNEETIPERFRPLVDIDMITNNTMSNGNILLESLGFTLVTSNKMRSVSNVINI